MQTRDTPDDIKARIRAAIDAQDVAEIRALFDAHPEVDWNTITSSGLSALWWAIVPPNGTAMSHGVVECLVNLRRNGRLVIDPAQQHAGLRPDYYIRQNVESDSACIRAIGSAQNRYVDENGRENRHEPANVNALVADRHSASNPQILNDADRSLKALHKRYASHLDKEQEWREIKAYIQSSDYRALFSDSKHPETREMISKRKEAIEAALQRIESDSKTTRSGMKISEGPQTLKDALILVWHAVKESDPAILSIGVDPKPDDRYRLILTGLYESQTAYENINNPSCWPGTWSRIGLALQHVHGDIYAENRPLTREEAVYKFNVLMSDQLQALREVDPNLYKNIIRYVMLGDDDYKVLYDAWISGIESDVHKKLSLASASDKDIEVILSGSIKDPDYPQIPWHRDSVSREIHRLHFIFSSHTKASELMKVNAEFSRLLEKENYLEMIREAVLAKFKVPNELATLETIEDFKKTILERYLAKPNDDESITIEKLWESERIKIRMINVKDESLLQWYNQLSLTEQSGFGERVTGELSERAILEYALKNQLVRGLSLAGRDLRNYDFRGWNLSGVDFRGTHLEGADMRLITAEDTKWEGCYLAGAKINPFEHTLAFIKSADSFEILASARDKYENTALHVAAREGRTKIVKAFLASEYCRPALLEARDKNGQTALHWAIGWPRAEIVKMLLASEHCRPALLVVQDKYGHTALYLAARDGHTEVVKVLLASEHCGPELLEARDNEGETALHVVIQAGHTEGEMVMKVLLASKHCRPALLVVQNKNGDTVLHMATRGHRTEIVEMLLASEHCGPALLEAREGKYGYTALHWAAQDGRTEVVEMLLASKHCRPALLEARDKDGHTALHNAVMFGITEVVGALLASEHCRAELLAVQNKDGYTALHLAAGGGHTGIVKAFLASKHCGPALLEARSKDGYTVLHVAVRLGYPEIVKLLENKINEFKQEELSVSEGYLKELMTTFPDKASLCQGKLNAMVKIKDINVTDMKQINAFLEAIVKITQNSASLEAIQLETYKSSLESIKALIPKGDLSSQQSYVSSALVRIGIFSPPQNPIALFVKLGEDALASMEKRKTLSQ